MTHAWTDFCFAIPELMLEQAQWLQVQFQNEDDDDDMVPHEDGIEGPLTFSQTLLSHPDKYSGWSHDIELQVEPDPTGWIATFCSEEGSDLDLLIDVLAEFTRLWPDLSPISFEWANNISPPEPEGFSGGAACIWRGTEKSMTTWRFLHDEEKRIADLLTKEEDEQEEEGHLLVS